ncbi:hypothetical protein DFH06DRAFT_456155 [Mycena polygramma]|nr:hypothetical protein DFH06DRAFT_456155 [Mycena polygramma]
MTSTNFTIDNINPLIQYSPPAAWTEGSKTSDPLASSYSNGGTFTLCTTQGSSATFTFNGTQVYVFGAKRSNHGPYSITLDGVATLFDGNSADPIFGPLFVSDVLAQKQHTVTLTNELTDTNSPFLDLDFITWTTNVAGGGQSKTVEDTADAFTYSPSTSWSTDLSSALLTGFSGNNGHVTLTAGASTSISFSGGFITVFGPVGPTISRYTVQLDGADGGTFNATKEAYTPQVALYTASGLGAGAHTLELISQPAVAGQLLAVDYIQVSPSSTATSGNSSSSASASPSAAAAKKSSSSSSGAAIGGAIAGVAVLGILAFLIFFMCRRKRRREQPMHPNQIVLEDKYQTAPGLSNYTIDAFPNNSRPSHVGGYSRSSSNAHSNAQLVQPPYGAAAPQSQYGGGLQSQYAPSAPSQYAPSAPSQYAPSQYAPSQYAGRGGALASSPGIDGYGGTESDPYGGMASPPMANPHPWNGSQSRAGAGGGGGGGGGDRRTFYTVNDGESDGASTLDRSSTMHSSGAAGLGAGTQVLRRNKGEAAPLPPTANQPLPPGEERIYVQGREQDAGPLPPDYEQATEPYRGGRL